MNDTLRIIDDEIEFLSYIMRLCAQRRERLDVLRKALMMTPDTTLRKMVLEEGWNFD